MDSEDEMQYDSLDENEDEHNFMEDDEFDQYDDVLEDDDEDDKVSKPSENYKVLTESDIKERQEDDITTVATVLSLSKAASTLVLFHHNWCFDRAKDEWFDDEDKVRGAVGLVPSSGPVVVKPSKKSEKVNCRICLEALTRDGMKSAGCGHLFCCECWESYIGISIADGPGCLTLRCPDPACRVAIDSDMVAIFASEEQKSKYYHYLRRSYIEASKSTKWCPAPGCEHAISYAGYNGNYDVCCPCKYSFCWNCTEETHRPVDCKTVKEWILKNGSEAENTIWILANTKACPKCQQHIEKNEGCMHMTCRKPCRFQFCWLCLGPWSEHDSNTGGYLACNKYEKAKREGSVDEAERRREMAKNSLDRYTHYYERWQGNHNSRQKALEDLHQMQTVNLDKIRDNQRETEAGARFLVEAWHQIVECRRVLKWTYAYGYYLPEHDTAKKQLFEFLQGEAESGLERLHHCAEKELQLFLEEDAPSDEFKKFQRKLIGLTAVTKNYFENLVKALENGLSDVKSQQDGGAAKSGKKRTAETEIDKGNATV